MTLTDLKAALQAVDTTELRRMAEAATPGKREIRGCGSPEHMNNPKALCHRVRIKDGIRCDLKEADNQYAAALDTATVIALCNAADHAGELLERLEQMRKALEFIKANPAWARGHAEAALASLSKPLGGAAEAGKDGAL